MSKPFFSVVIPSFNRADFILNTIKSVLIQSYENFEIVFIDDGSTDNTEVVINSINDKRIKYHKINNSERGAARNLGGKMAKGEYITFLDSDDVFYSNHLGVASNFLKHTGYIDIFFQQYEIIREHRITKLPYRPKNNIINAELNKKGNFMSCHGVFIKREIFMQNQFNEDRRLAGSEDYELWLRLAAKYPIFYSEKITSALVQHESRSVLKMNVNQLVQRKELMLSYLMSDKQFVEKSGHSIKLIKSNAYLYVSLHLSMIKRTERRLAFKYLIKSIKSSLRALEKKSFYVTIYRLLLT